MSSPPTTAPWSTPLAVQAVTVEDRAAWNNTLAEMPYAHILQTWEWGDFKQATTGWNPRRIAFMHRGDVVAMAQILTRQEAGLRIMYVPKGPVLDYTNPALRQGVLRAIKQQVDLNGGIFLKIDPDINLGTGVPGEPDATELPLGHEIAIEWKQAGLRPSDEQIQFRNSVIIDLRRPEDDILMEMKQKTRYNIRLASRRDVTVRLGGPDDIDVLYELYAETARRDGFVIRPLDYYRRAWVDFIRAGLAQPIIAEFKGEAIAHVIIFGFGKRAWYMYGASTDDDARRHMPTYLLQWEAIRWAREQKMAVYDMWGAPDEFTNKEDPLAGVYRFKSGFGGIVVRRIGAWDYPARPGLYGVYHRVMPAILGVMRSIGRRRLQQEGQTSGDSA